MIPEAHMHKREVDNQRHAPLLRDRQARQAGRWFGDRPHGRFRGAGDRMSRRQRAGRHRLSPADGRLQGIHLRVGTDSRRILQARRQAFRKGGADQPRASIGRFGRCSRPAGATRPRSSRSCCRPTRTTIPTCSRSPAPRRRWRCRAFPFRRRLPGCASARWTAQYVINPTYEQRRKSRSIWSSPAATMAW